MSGSILRHVGRRAGLAFSAPPRLHSRAYVRSHPHSSRYRDTTSSPGAAAAAAASATAAAAAAASAAKTASAAAARKGVVNWYLGMIEARPILTKSLTAGVIFTAADMTSQIITAPDSLDWIRTLRMAGYGMLVSGPSLHIWFNFLSRILPSRDVLNTFKKMFLGQATYGPVMTAVFFSVNAGLQGETGYEIIARLKRDLLPTLLNGLVYWPLCDFITFKFVPVRLQPLVSNSFSFLWTIYITYMAGLQKATVERITED